MYVDWQPTVSINTLTAVNQIFINIRGNVITITILKLKYLKTTTVTKKLCIN